MFVETKREGELAVPLQPWRRVLWNAADYIEKHGHVKGWRQSERGAVCLHGALAMMTIGHASGGNERDDSTDYGRACMLIRDYLRSRGVPKDEAAEGGCAGWNNAKERTAQEVINALREAACWSNVGG